jgi:hypothetical protein
MHGPASHRLSSVQGLSTDIEYNSPVANHERKDSMTATQPPPPHPLAHDGLPRHVPRRPMHMKVEQPIDPELSQTEPSSQPGYAEAIAAWQRFRFVRAGWFTAVEAIDYID